MTVTARTFAVFAECPRCNGLKHAFATFPTGLCFACGGSLRKTWVRPVGQLSERTREQFAGDLASIKRAVDAVGAPREKGRGNSRWGFTDPSPVDTLMVFVECVSRAEANVRARAWAAWCKAAEEKLSAERAAKLREATINHLSECTGIPLADVPAWLGAV